ncbi:GNAT family N-acetyltransferase [Virgibacillus dakarensis]|nr:GNAT family N-acetyltransferase [Lentibacillus populi]MTW88070.1 GNAT family N-acetyltransferase [Virgibacillus dakarensis]
MFRAQSRTVFKKEAIRLEKHHACKTHLYYYKDNLLGYYTLFTDYVNLTRSKRNSEGWGDVSTLLGNQHFPAIRLHYIGIDDKYRNKGLIELLLLFALDDCIYISNYVGFNFVVLEALKRSVGFFEKQNFSKVKKNNDLQIMAIKVEDIVFQLGS